jgi:DNA-directed RNA polymerase specialized sigma24 family protein
MSYAEMAEVIKVKKTSVGKLLSRAIDRCARHIKILRADIITGEIGENGI